MIVGFELCGCDIPIAIYQMLKDIAERDSKEDGILILQFLEVGVFGGVNDLVLEGLVCNTCILLYYISFVVLEL